MSAALDLIDLVRSEVAQAVDAVLSGVEESLADLAEARRGDAGALDRIELALMTVLAACSVQDITGQRLSTLSAMIATNVTGSIPDGGLLNGPALPDQGLDQNAADRLLATPGPT